MLRHLVPLILIAGCSKSPMAQKSARLDGAAALADSGGGSGADARGLVDTKLDALVADARIPGIVILDTPEVGDAPADSTALDGPGCGTFSDDCAPAGCGFPIDWESAQNPASWCKAFGLPDSEWPSWNSWLCTNSDGYRQVTLAHWRGGELPGVDLVVYMLYDPVTGKFVQDRDAYGLDEPSKCVFGVLGGPANVSTACAGGRVSFKPVCPSGMDAGATP